MRLARLALAATLALLVAACSGSPSAPSPSARAASSPAAVQIVQVRLFDTLRMEPAAITVQAGQPVRFIVTNMGATNHEFYLGDKAAQMAHGRAMAGMPGMAHDEPDGIGLMPGETKTLDHAFVNSGSSMAGCHVNDHYAAGMKVAITIEP